MKGILTFYILAVLCLTILVSCENVTEPQSIGPDPSLYLCNIDGSGKISLHCSNNVNNVFSPDGNFVYSVFPDSILQIGVFEGDKKVFNISIGTITYSPPVMNTSGRYICVSRSQSGNNSLFIFDVEQGTEVHLPNQDGDQFSSVFYQNRLYLSYSNPSGFMSIEAIDVEHPETFETILNSLDVVRDLCISKDGRLLFYQDYSNHIFKYDTLTNKHTEISPPWKFIDRSTSRNLHCLAEAEFLFVSFNTLPGFYLFDYEGNSICSIGNGFHPSFSQTGDLVSYSLGSYEYGDILVHNASTGRSTIIDNHSNFPIISPVGTKLLYSRF